jgi:hypothetical protein
VNGIERAMMITCLKTIIDKWLVHVSANKGEGLIVFLPKPRISIDGKGNFTRVIYDGKT